jgi:spermidine/putrescine transport system ATP-binding protein
MTDPRSIVSLRGVAKNFGRSTVVDDLDLDIREGEFFSLLGPSGCGKTSTLRMIGGFSRPDRGTIEIEGVDVTATPPNRRNVNTVFQSYALFEHLTVSQNIAFGLRRRRVPADEIQRRVGEMLELVDLGPRANARPAELSGGQKQRVALARAIVNMPKVLLLDEPLGALDLMLRRQMQVELKRIQREVGITFIYVTHDQEEALTMSDRIAVMRAGKIEQLAEPRELYEQPRTPFVAGFIGSANLLLARRVGSRAVVDGGPTLDLPAGFAETAEVTLSVRPEHVRFGEGAALDPSVEGVLVDAAYLGHSVQATVNCGPGLAMKLTAPVREVGALSVGSRVTVSWRAEDTVFVAGLGQGNAETVVA